MIGPHEQEGITARPEVLRMWGDRVDDIRPKIAADVRGALADFVINGGTVIAASSTWAVTARVPV